MLLLKSKPCTAQVALGWQSSLMATACMHVTKQLDAMYACIEATTVHANHKLYLCWCKHIPAVGPHACQHHHFLSKEQERQVGAIWHLHQPSMQW